MRAHFICQVKGERVEISILQAVDSIGTGSRPCEDVWIISNQNTMSDVMRVEPSSRRFVTNADENSKLLIIEIHPLRIQREHVAISIGPSECISDAVLIRSKAIHVSGDGHHPIGLVGINFLPFGLSKLTDEVVLGYPESLGNRS